MFDVILALFTFVLILWLIKTNDNCKKKCEINTIDTFEPNDMYENESLNVFRDTRFSLDCCPSTYTNDKGCACINNDVHNKDFFKCKA